MQIIFTAAVCAAAFAGAYFGARGAARPPVPPASVRAEESADAREAAAWRRLMRYSGMKGGVE